MKKTLLLLALSILLLNACTSKRDKISSEIKERESKLFAKGNAFDLKTPDVQALIDKYELFANSFPEDTLAAEYLYKSADLYTGVKNYKAAMNCYERVISKYPNYSKISYCIFLAGFNAENNLLDTQTAKKYYELFLQKYPDAAMADDVRFSLKNLGRSADDIVREFEEKLRLEDSLKSH